MPADLPETSYAVLGLVDKRPASGHEIAALAARSLRYFWPVSRTLVYRELSRLEGLGWAEAIEVAQDRFPEKRVWSSTAEGQEALTDWLSRPAMTGGDSFRSGVLLKFMFGARMSPTDLASLLAGYRESLEATVTELTALAKRLRNSPEATMGRLAALHGLRTAEARLAWLEEIAPELAQQTLAAPADRGFEIRSGSGQR